MTLFKYSRILIRKICLLGILLLMLVIFAEASLQIPWVQGKIAHWIEKKTQGELIIGKIEGILPFRFTLKNVSYKTDKMKAHIDEMHATLSPVSLLLGKLTVVNLTIHQAHIFSSTSSWPSFPISIEIHSFTISHLFTNELDNVAIKGSASLGDCLSARLLLKDPKEESLDVRLSIEGDQKTQSFNLLGSIHEAKLQCTLWVKGLYAWNTQSFTGSILAEGWGYKGMADMVYTAHQSVKLSSLYIKKQQEYISKGMLNYDLNTQSFAASGSLLDFPFSIDAMLFLKDKTICVSSLLLSYCGEQAEGELSYSLKERQLLGKFSIEMKNLALFPLEHSLKGVAKAQIIIEKEKLTFDVQGKDLSWKDMSIPVASCSGNIHNGSLCVNLNCTNVTLNDPAYELFPLINCNLSAAITKNTLSIDGQLYGLSETPFNFVCTLPISFKFFPLDFFIKKDEPFHLHLSGKGPMDPLLAFLENASLIASGKIDLDMRATGTWNQPDLKGHLIYENGRIESLKTGALFRDIHMELEGKGKELHIRSLMAHDIDKGDLTGSGHILWDLHKHFPFSFRIHASRYQILSVDPLTATVDADITFSGNVKEMSLTGKALLIKGHLSIPSKIPVNIPLIDVSYLNPLPSPKPEIQEVEKPIPLHWDIAIDAPRNLTIEGRGLNSEWSGTLKIAGEQNRLSYKGKLRLVQGRFSLINRTFELVEGRVRVDGLTPKDIFVDLKGDYQMPTVTASILVVGSLDNTHVSFCSNPPMNTKQILSWIVFQQDINELTPFQACRLASLLVSLSGKYSGPKTLENIKAGLGLDVFSITDCNFDSADLTFQVGKYLSQGTFVGINKSISGDFDSVMIQTRLFRNFFLEANYGGSLNKVTSHGGKAILKWYKSY